MKLTLTQLSNGAKIIIKICSVYSDLIVSYLLLSRNLHIFCNTLTIPFRPLKPHLDPQHPIQTPSTPSRPSEPLYIFRLLHIFCNTFTTPFRPLQPHLDPQHPIQTLSTPSRPSVPHLDPQHPIQTPKPTLHFQTTSYILQYSYHPQDPYHPI